MHQSTKFRQHRATPGSVDSTNLPRPFFEGRGEFRRSKWAELYQVWAVHIKTGASKFVLECRYISPFRNQDASIELGRL